jgi:hypothetical protein
MYAPGAVGDIKSDVAATHDQLLVSTFAFCLLRFDF